MSEQQQTRALAPLDRWLAVTAEAPGGGKADTAIALFVPDARGRLTNRAEVALAVTGGGHFTDLVITDLATGRRTRVGL